LSEERDGMRWQLSIGQNTADRDSCVQMCYAGDIALCDDEGTAQVQKHRDSKRTYGDYDSRGELMGFPVLVSETSLFCHFISFFCLWRRRSSAYLAVVCAFG